MLSPDEQISGIIFLLGQHVTTDAGTGIVHTAPGHGHDDYVSWKVKQGELLLSEDKHRDSSEEDRIACPVDEFGTYNSDINDLVESSNSSCNLQGLSVLSDGNSAVIQQLTDSGALYHKEDYVHRYPHDWRTKGPIITRATKQWFANVGKLHSKAVEALQNVKMVPPVSSARLENMITGREEWCISRQRHWGVPIPVFYNTQDGSVLATEESLSHVAALVKEHGTDCWWTMALDELLPPSIVKQGQTEMYTKCTDTLDVWFDSGSSWAAVLGQKGMKLPDSVSGRIRPTSRMVSVLTVNIFSSWKSLCAIQQLGDTWFCTR